jgi:hypothetical protein
MNKIECKTCIKRKTIYCPNSSECYATEDKRYYQNRIMLLKENEILKHRLNDIDFGDDTEFALRYLRKIGYVGFNEEKKTYINLHNNEPFLHEEEKEKDYYIKDEELDEYTKVLEKENEKLKDKIDKTIEYNRNQIKDIKDFYRNTKDRIYSGDTIIEIAEQNIEILKGDSDE